MGKGYTGSRAELHLLDWTWVPAETDKEPKTPRTPKSIAQILNSSTAQLQERKPTVHKARFLNRTHVITVAI